MLLVNLRSNNKSVVLSYFVIACRSNVFFFGLLLITKLEYILVNSDFEILTVKANSTMLEIDPSFNIQICGGYIQECELSLWSRPEKLERYRYRVGSYITLRVRSCVQYKNILYLYIWAQICICITEFFRFYYFKIIHIQQIFFLSCTQNHRDRVMR